MTDIIAKKSQFDIIVTRADDRLQVTDPITIKNQIQEIHSIDDLGLNLTNRVDGSLVTWNANTNMYDVKPFNTYATFTWGNTHVFNSNVVFNSALLANNTSGLAGQILTSNGNGVYWANSTPYTFGAGLSTNNGVVSVNSVYIATLSSNNASYLDGKIESNLNANSAVYLNGFQSSYFAANSSLANYYLASNPAGYITSSSSITGSANNSTYLGGKIEANLNVNSASYAILANNASYVFGKIESDINANSAVYSNSSIFALTSNNSSYLGGFNSSYFAANSSLVNYYLASNPAGYITSSGSITGSANNATYLGDKTEANLNVNSASYAVTANNSAYLGGFNSSYFAANSSLVNYYLASNPAGYITSSGSITGSANNSTYLGGKTEANLNVNSAVYSTNSQFTLIANNASYFNNQPASYYSNASNLSTGTIAFERLPSPRVVSITDGVSITVNVDVTDIATQINTQISGTLTINPTTGTPRNGQKFILKIQSTNSQTFSWDTSFGGSVDMGLPTSTTGGGQIDYMGFQYDSISTKWHMIAKNFGF